MGKSAAYHTLKGLHAWRDAFVSRGERGGLVYWWQCARCGVVCNSNERRRRGWTAGRCPGDVWVMIGAPASGAEWPAVQPVARGASKPPRGAEVISW